MDLRWLRPIVFALLGAPLGWWARGVPQAAESQCVDPAWVVSAAQDLDALLAAESAQTELDCSAEPCRWLASGVLERQDFAQLVAELEAGRAPGAVDCRQEVAGFECAVALERRE